MNKFIEVVLKVLAVVFSVKVILSILLLLSEAAIWEVLLTSFILLLFFKIYKSGKA